MAQRMVQSRLCQKQDTGANWAANDPVLLNGEIILAKAEDGGVRIKVGDGQKRFSQLAYTDEPLREQIAQLQAQLAGKSDLVDGKVKAEQSSSMHSVVSASRALTAEDRGKLLLVTASSPVTLTIPSDATASIPNGTEIEIVQYSLGQVTIAPESGAVSVQSLDDKVASAGPYAILSLKKLNTNEWLLGGALA